MSRNELDSAIKEYVVYAKARNFSELKNVYLKIHNLYEALSEPDKLDFKSKIEQIEKHLGREGHHEIQPNEIEQWWMKYRGKVGVGVIVLVFLIAGLYLGKVAYIAIDTWIHTPPPYSLQRAAKEILQAAEANDALYTKEGVHEIQIINISRKKISVEEVASYNSSKQFYSWQSYGYLGQYLKKRNPANLKKLNDSLNNLISACSPAIQYCNSFFLQCETSKNCTDDELYDNLDIYLYKGACDYSLIQPLEAYQKVPEALNNPALNKFLNEAFSCTEHSRIVADTMLEAIHARTLYKFGNALQLPKNSSLSTIELRMMNVREKPLQFIRKNDPEGFRIMDSDICWSGLAEIEANTFNPNKERVEQLRMYLKYMDFLSDEKNVLSYKDRAYVSKLLSCLNFLIEIRNLDEDTRQSLGVTDQKLETLINNLSQYIWINYQDENGFYMYQKGNEQNLLSPDATYHAMYLGSIT